MGNSEISARELILSLIDSSSQARLSAAYFVAAGALFDMDSGTIRVALARLVRDGALKSVRRGQYTLDNRSGELHQRVRGWADVESGLRAWNGGWLTVYLGHLKRSEKTRQRGRERALRLGGFASLDTGLWIRPDNLEASGILVRDRLVALGLDQTAWLAVASSLNSSVEIQPQRLWDIPDLEARYRSQTTRLRNSRERLPSIDDNEAARETLLVGRSVTRDILLDPLLPEALCDTRLRTTMIEEMRDYDRIGKTLWRAFYGRFLGNL